MAADPSDIAPALRRALVESWSDSAIKTRYPNARDGLSRPAEGFFDTAANGATAIAFRGSLFGVERRRFTATVQDLVWPSPETAIPIVALVDTELALNGNMMTARIAVDLDGETTSYEVFG